MPHDVNLILTLAEKLSAARWAMMSAESLCPIKK